MHRHELRDHIYGTYVSLRYGLAAMGAALPLVLFVIGWFHGVGLQGSLSAYYWAPDGVNAPARNWFVGSLFALAACLYLYKGFTRAENVALNLAAVFAVGVALIPSEWNCTADCGRFSAHGTSAVLMFLCLVFVVWFCAHDTLTLLPEPIAARYRKTYRTLGLVMLASPLTAFVMNSFLGGGSYVFFVEAAGIWAFAAYWLVKSSEFGKSQVTRRALRGEVETTPEGKAVAVPPDAQ